MLTSKITDYQILKYSQSGYLERAVAGNTEILTQDVRKTKYFKELFNEQRNKDTCRM